MMLESGITVKAQIMTDMNLLKERLAEIGTLRLIKDGTTLSYELSDAKASAVISFGHDGISMHYCCEAPSKAIRKRMFARLLSVLVSIEGLYSIGLSAIYAETIDNIDFEGFEKNAHDTYFMKYSKRLKMLSGINYLLYGSFSEVRDENLRLGEMVDMYKTLLFEALRSWESISGKKMQVWQEKVERSLSDELIREYQIWCKNERR